MKKILLVMMALAITSLFAACDSKAPMNAGNKPANAANAANTSNSNNATNPAAADTDIKKLITDYAASTEKNDASAYDKVTSDNFMFVSNDGTVQTKAERLATMRSGQTKYEVLKYDDVTVRVNAEGDSAVAIGKATVKGTNNGKPIDSTVRVTQVWSKTKDGWKMVSLQATNITSTAAPSEPVSKNDEANKSPANK